MGFSFHVPLVASVSGCSKWHCCNIYTGKRISICLRACGVEDKQSVQHKSEDGLPQKHSAVSWDDISYTL